MVRKTAATVLGQVTARALLAFLVGFAGVEPASAADSAASIPKNDAIRLAEAYRIVAELGDEIWPGFAAVPMPIVVVAGEVEYLVDWQGPAPEGFEELGVDPIVGRSVLVRARTFPPGWSASFPAFGPPAVVVIGTAEAVAKNSTQWVQTVLHEHFHQLQYGAAGYYQGVEALDLSGGDETGMWMLDYPFPYEDVAIGAKFAELAGRTHKALTARHGPKPEPEPWLALRELLNMLEPPDARYLSFQLWQEGIARYIEVRAAQVVAAALEPDAAFMALDEVTWADEARSTRQRILGELEGVDLARNGRVSFYALGAALGLLLDQVAPGWESRYLEEKFTLLDYGLRAPLPAG